MALGYLSYLLDNMSFLSIWLHGLNSPLLFIPQTVEFFPDSQTQTRACTKVSALPSVPRDCVSVKWHLDHLKSRQKYLRFFFFFKPSQGGEDGHTHSPMSSSHSSSPTPCLNTKKSPNATCPSPDKQQQPSHHRMTGFDPEGKYFPWLYKTDLGKCDTLQLKRCTICG